MRISLSGIILILGIIFFNGSCQSNNIIEDDDPIKKYQVGLNALATYMAQQMLLENERVIDSAKVVTKSFDTLNFSNILPEYAKLFFHYTDKQCSDCLAKQFEILEMYQDSIGSNNIILLANVKSLRKLSTYFRQKKLKYNFFQILDYQEVVCNSDLIENPFYFVANSDGVINHVHLPDKDMTSITNYYFKTLIARKIFQK